MTTKYLIPGETHRTTDTVKRSRFITTLAHAPSAHAAKAFLATVREEFPDATHNCFAYLAGPPGNTAHIGMSDDGEPHGTAGRPMLNMLLHSDVGEIAAVVTRYFGGTKLGTGGLVRAYSGAVKNALSTLKRVEKRELVRFKATIDYRHVQDVKMACDTCAAVCIKEDYSENVALLMELPRENQTALIGKITDLTQGAANIDLNIE